MQGNNPTGIKTPFQVMISVQKLHRLWRKRSFFDDRRHRIPWQSRYKDSQAERGPVKLAESCGGACGNQCVQGVAGGFDEGAGCAESAVDMLLPEWKHTVSTSALFKSAGK